MCNCHRNFTFLSLDFFGTTIQNGSESDFHTILQTMDSTCEEQLLIAYKTAFDIKAHALRLNDDFMDRVLATTKILLGMQLIDDPTNKLEFNDGMATLLANSFKNIILKEFIICGSSQCIDLGCDGY